MGKPVTDIGVFTGEEVPRRSVLPERLVNILPGIFGKDKVKAEKERLENQWNPMRQMPDGVTNSANIPDPLDWIDPLNGYSYDSFNPDALMTMQYKDGKIELPSGASYKLLIFPGSNPMNPIGYLMSLPVARKILELVKAGAIVLMDTFVLKGVGLKDNDIELKKTIAEIKSAGTKGNLIKLPFAENDFTKQGIQKDIEIERNDHAIAWTHRQLNDMDIYFVANQSETAKSCWIKCRIDKKTAEWYDPEKGMLKPLAPNSSEGRVLVYLPPHGSQFLIFSNHMASSRSGFTADISNLFFKSPWTIRFNKEYGGPTDPVVMDSLKSWTESQNSAIKYYSGTAIYSNEINLDTLNNQNIFLCFNAVYDIASVKVNGIDCGTVWTPSYQIEITKALRTGNNKVEIEVSNTWHNRLIGDHLLPERERLTWTNAPFRLKDKPLLPAGLIGKIFLLKQ
jgi:hypothetical protein